MYAKSDSDITSLDPSSPRTPKRPVYYVQSPSRDSNDEDKSSNSMQTTPAYTSPMDSPSHTSYGHHSRASSSSRVSGGGFRWSSYSGRKGRKKGWSESNAILEEAEHDFVELEAIKWCQLWMGVVGVVTIFTIFCLILWGASRPYKPQVIVESLTVHDFYHGEGSDLTGVPTKMLTVNSSLKMIVNNPATFFGFHIRSTIVNLKYSELVVATGQMKKFYQRRKSYRVVNVELIGNGVPLYGAGESLVASENVGGGVPMTVVFEIQSQGNVVGKLVRSKHHSYISCSLGIKTYGREIVKLNKDSCKYFI